MSACGDHGLPEGWDANTCPNCDEVVRSDAPDEMVTAPDERGTLTAEEREYLHDEMKPWRDVMQYNWHDRTRLSDGIWTVLDRAVERILSDRLRAGSGEGVERTEYAIRYGDGELSDPTPYREHVVDDIANFRRLIAVGHHDAADYEPMVVVSRTVTEFALPDVVTEWTEASE